MPADDDASSPSVLDLQRRIEELSAELRARTAERDEAQRREAAIAEILQVTNASAGDLAQVFAAMIEKATRLCAAAYGYIWLYDGQQVVPVATHAEQQFSEWLLHERGSAAPPTEAPLGRALRDRSLVHVVDAKEDPAYRNLPRFRELIDRGGVRTLLHVPLRKGEDLLGVITVYRQEARPFSDAEIRLLEAFAAQAVIAMENARLLNELRQRTEDLSESLQRQTATADVLKAISRSAFDLQKVLDTLVEAAAVRCGADIAVLRRRVGSEYPVAATHGYRPEWREHIEHYSPQPRPGSIFGRVALENRTVHIPDVFADPQYARPETQQLLRFRASLGVPLHREAGQIGILVLQRFAPGPFTASQIELVETFADQAVIAIENARLMAETREALERQTATSEVLGVISSSPEELEPVFRSILSNAIALCRADLGNLFLYEDNAFRVAAMHGASPGYAEAWRRDPVLSIVDHPQVPLARLAATKQVVHIPDLAQERIQLERDPRYTALFEAARARTMLLVPMLKDGELIGAIVIYAPEVRPFDGKHIDLVVNFARQAVIAIENSRLLKQLRDRTHDLQKSLEYQTATSDVLKVISRSTFELQPVLDTLVTSAARLCNADMAAFYRPRGDVYRCVATTSVTPGWDAFVRDRPYLVDRGTVVGRTVLEGRVVHIADLAVDPEYRLPEAITIGGFRTTVGVPLFREGEPNGVFVLGRKQVEPFTNQQIELVRTFADQAAIAIENTRLLGELRQRSDDLEESLEYQSATSGVLNVISRSPTDAQPVFEAIAESTARLCQVEFCHVYRFDGELIHFMASYGHTPEATEAIRRLYPTPPSRRSCAARAILSSAVEQVPDVRADPDYAHGDVADILKISSVVAVPMLKEGRPVGAIAVLRAASGIFPQRQVELLQTFADQAVIAINNVGLFDEVQARARDLQESLEYQTATSDVLKVISYSTFDLQSVLDTLSSTAARLCLAEMSFMTRRTGDAYRFVTAVGSTPETTRDAVRLKEAFLDQRIFKAGRESITGRVVAEKQVVQIVDVAADPDYAQTEIKTIGKIRTLLGVPMMREREVIGTMSLGRQRVEPFTEKQIELVKTFADQAVIAVENARLLGELRDRTRDLEESLEHQIATSDVLKVISRSTFDLHPVLQTLAETAIRLCDAEMCYVLRREGEAFRAVAVAVSSPQARAGAVEYLHFLETHPLSPGRGSLTGRVALEGHAVQMDDVTADPEYVLTEATTLAKIRTQLGVPLMREGSMIGVIALSRQRVAPFSDRQIDLLRTFADQAVIAIENTRLLTEQREALEQQTAAAEVLQVINSSPGNLTPVFDIILEKAMHLCEAAFGMLWMADDDRVIQRGAPAEYADYLATHRVVTGQTWGAPGTIPARILDGEPLIHVVDLADEPPYRSGDPHRRALVDIGGARTALAVPLRKDTAVFGFIMIYRREVRLFSDKQAALLQNFAVQAVIAIENARLLTEQREALEQQTATAEVLQVINASPGNLVPVFETILEKAHALCGAAYGALHLYDDGKFHAVATHGLPERFADQLRQGFTPGPNLPVQRLLQGEGFVQVADLAEIHNPVAQSAVRLVGLRTALFVALRKDGDLLGQIVASRKEVRPFTDKEIALIRSFAAQAVIAMENARLLTEQREALERQTATAEVLQVINSSPGDLAPVFDEMLEKATRLCEAAYGVLWTYDGHCFRAAAMRALPSELVAFLGEPQLPAPDTGIGRVAAGEPFVHWQDLKDSAAYHSVSPIACAFVDLGGARTGIIVGLRKEAVLLGAISIYRQEVRPFTDKQISLLQNFAAQAVIAMENARLLTEQREALEQQTATAQVLQVINSSPGNLAPVFEAMLERAMTLCGAAFGVFNTFDGQHFHTVATHGVPEAYAQFRTANPPDYGPETGPGRLLAGEDCVHIVDMAEGDLCQRDANRRAIVELGGARTILIVALRKEGALLGMIAIYRQEVRPFTDKQIALLQNFAAQAVIAMENARLLTEQREALEQQTATTEVLEVINASPGNLAPVFDAMLERAVRLSESAFGMMNLYENDRFKGVALRGVPPGILSFEATPQPGPHNALTRLVNGEDAVHIEDLKTYRSYVEGDPRSRHLVDVCGARSLLAVALRKDGRLIGSLTAYRQEVRPFTDKQIALLEGFATQAVIAIDNARLLDELRQRQAELARSVEELTATGDVLKIISRSSVDLKTVLETLVERVAHLCRADQAYMFRRQDELHHLMAAYGVSPEGEEFIRNHPFVPERGTTSGRVALEHRPIHIADVLEDPDYTYREGQAIAGFRTMLGIPLLREETLVGVFVVGRTRVAPFTPKEIELVTSFADQAVIAIENARLFEEIRQRQAELRVTFDNMGDGVVMFDADLRLAAWNRNFQEIMKLSDADLAARPSYVEYLHLLADRGEFGTENVEATLASRLEDTDKELRLERTRPDGTVIEARRNAVPGGGFVLIYSDITERKRSEEQIRAARDLAETRLRELRAAQSSLIHAEKMASLGQLTAGIAHEIKNPLNFVNNFAGLSVELLDELRETMTPLRETLDADRRTEIDETIELLNTNLDRIASHGRRADGIVRSMLLHSRGGSSDRQTVDINVVLEEALNLAYHGARAQDQSFNVTLERELQPDIAPIEIVPQDVTRVFLNLIGNGFYAVARRARLGGDTSFRPTLKVRTRDLDAAVEIAIRDNGTGISPEHRARLFQPFFTTKPTGEGTGLGLSISYDIVTQQHGGAVEVDSEPGQFTEFTVRLPRRGSAATGRGPA